MSLIGPESAGKTSLVKSLKGEAFNKEEPSTQVVVINSPIEIVRTKAWKNATYDQKTTPSDSMCADLIARDVKRDIPAEQKCKQLLEPRMVGNGMLLFCLMQMFLKFEASRELDIKSI